MSAAAIAQIALFPAEPESVVATGAPDAPPGARPRLRVVKRCAPGDMWQLGRHRLLCGDSTMVENAARLMGGAQAHYIALDPPYGAGMDTWDTGVDAPGAVLAPCIERMRPDGFLSLFQQMPYALPWLVALAALPALRFTDHVVWVKRIQTALALPLNRSHESLFIYRRRAAHYHTTKGRYEDVKVPGVLVDTATLDGIMCHINDLRRKLAGKPSRVMYDNKPHAAAYAYFPPKISRSPELANFTNVWSFLPENHHTRGKAPIAHTTAKPVMLMERAVALCAPDEGIVVDPFAGSGTTLIACERTGRTCYAAEIDPVYCDAIIGRWETATGQRAARI